MALLPFRLDFCAIGPDIAPLTCNVASSQVTIYFPPSMSEGTDGQAIFGDWAWWKADRVHVTTVQNTDTAEDVDALREIAIETAEEALRRLLNAVRDRFDRPDVHPVRIDPRNVQLFAVSEDGSREALSEPFAAFFYHNMPKDPPLTTSINTTTLSALKRDVEEPREPTLARQFELDALNLEDQGEHLRADLIRMLARQQM